ncbi:MAG TPA: zinc metalloprotease [Gaiellaceae bacterium]|nr:zinc metalloprotease [Gaiellaceae bacterium]
MRTRLLAACALALALVGSLTVSPASAAVEPRVSWSDACGANDFSSLGRLAVSSTARGGDGLREPDLGQVHTEIAGQRGRGANFRVTVPTWVHVVSDGAIGNVSDRAIRDQMQVLNMTFGGFEGGVATGFRFDLVGVTRTDNADWHDAGPGGAEHRMKRALHRGGDDTLNIYLTTAGIYLGWAYLPNITENPGQAYLDGIVVDWESMLGTSTRYAGRFDQGETATHEAGHWLNLEHTFFHGCSGEGDFVDDTPYERTPTSGCPAGKDTCPEPGLDPIHNYMDYSFDTCYTEFTAGQAARMQDAWLVWRAS